MMKHSQPDSNTFLRENINNSPLIMALSLRCENGCVKIYYTGIYYQSVKTNLNLPWKKEEGDF